MEENEEIGPLIDIGPLTEQSTNKNSKGRRSFYEMPRTLSEEDDTFGILSHTTNSDCKSLNPSEHSVNTGMLVEIDSSQSSSDSLGLGISQQLPSSSHQLLQSSKLDVDLGTSLHSSTTRANSQSSYNNSRCFGNISHISTLGDISGGRSLLSNDSVFSSQPTENTNDPPNWDMIMNEAQILASTINKDPKKKTVASTALKSGGPLANFSPASVTDGLDSPLLDLEKEFCKPDEFLVPLTPDRSPVKDLTKALNVNGEVEGVLPISPPLQTLDEEAIDGDIPLAKNDHDTPKISHRVGRRNSMQQKDKVRPRQLLSKQNKTPDGSKENLGVEEEESNSVKKQTRSKVQQSNVRRTSMTNPGLMSSTKAGIDAPNATKSDKRASITNNGGTHNSKPSNRLSGVLPQKPPLLSHSNSKPGTPVVPRGARGGITTPLSKKIDLKNVQSRINTGMPSVKSSITKNVSTNGKAQMPSAKKPVLPSSTKKLVPATHTNNNASTTKRVPVLPPSGSLSASLSKKAPTPSIPRGVLQRQGSNLTNQAQGRRLSSSTTTTPLKSRQSLSFVTPAAPGSHLHQGGGGSHAAGARSGLKPPTPSRLQGPKIRTPGGVYSNNASKSTTNNSSQQGQQHPKSRSSLRFSSTLPPPPSPMRGGRGSTSSGGGEAGGVGNKENSSLVCSTPAVGSAVNPGRMGVAGGSATGHSTAGGNNVRGVGLPSPIKVQAKRRSNATGAR
eukprot:TRINITY_DN3078_c0_g1_i12.p1 TRINITY_DN3078_c0_g1~~TRINITY_DN3078_c0_g1_i12.p1  ORF type:complete len:728 (-),score=139.32 TRINITY_DN3078_c0_g1_i12:456-2639(-)